MYELCHKFLSLFDDYTSHMHVTTCNLLKEQRRIILQHTTVISNYTRITVHSRNPFT
jgi:hypothetical protein